MADVYQTLYNPDVLSCLANLSNDEVFTPPEVANSMLDMLPQELFSDPNTKFLDPACRSCSAARTPHSLTLPANLACFCGKLLSGCWWGWKMKFQICSSGWIISSTSSSMALLSRS